MSTVTFYDNYAPPVKDGQYTVTVSQSLTADTASVPPAPQPAASQTFILRGPRFGIDPADVQRAFPADSSTGVYDQFLPMVVLNSRSLPWEREMDVSGEVAPGLYPWVALLVFDASELLVPGGGAPPPAGSQQSPTRAAAMPLTDVMSPPAGTLGPTLTLEDDEDPAQIQCNVIEVAAATFESLVGGVDDLRLLAHVREVTTESKESSVAGQTWFSTVVANRFALAPDVASPGPRANVCHLVSLEGFDTHLGAGGPTVPQGTDRVRMISLYAWAFTALPDPAENFEQLAVNLISPASDAGSGLLMRIPPPSWSAGATLPNEATGLALERIQDGYAALSYRTQSGGETFAWYRGPLSPVPVTEFMGNAPPGTPVNPEAPTSASDALVYDQANGLFDTSYAVAFQTGRSLALASLPFATALLQYRRTSHALVDQLLELMSDPVLSRKLVADGILDASGGLTSTGIADLAALLETGVTPNALVDVLATVLADGIAAQVGETGGFTAADAQQKPGDPATPQPSVPAELSALMQDPSVTTLLLQLSGLQSGPAGSGTFEASLLPDSIVEWLAQTALLQGVPFSNLVPDARMLPVESIRFFYVDPNWIDALIDGALSAGVQSSRDSLLQQLLRDPLHDAVDAAVLEVRDKLRAVPAGTTKPPPLGSVAGFVLRSALVEGWPGLEFRAWSSADATDPMKPLRLDRVAPGVLIAIYPDIPVKVELNEPSEGLVFGMEDDGIAVRYLPGTTGETAANEGEMVLGGDGKPIWLAPAAIAALRRPGLDEGPIRIAGAGGLAAALQALLPGEAQALGPAALAVEMVKVPEQMLFEPVVSQP